MENKIEIIAIILVKMEIHRAVTVMKRKSYVDFGAVIAHVVVVVLCCSWFFFFFRLRTIFFFFSFVLILCTGHAVSSCINTMTLEQHQPLFSSYIFFLQILFCSVYFFLKKMFLSHSLLLHSANMWCCCLFSSVFLTLFKFNITSTCNSAIKLKKKKHYSITAIKCLTRFLFNVQCT